MQTIWEGHKNNNKDTKEFYDRLNAVERKCVPFQLVCREIKGKWGIWFLNSGNEALVNPIDLINSLFEDCHYSAEPLYHDSKLLWFYSRQEEYCFCWSLEYESYPYSGRWLFTKKDYVSKIKDVVKQLYQKMKDGAAVDYSRIELSLEGLQQGVYQLSATGTLPSVFARTTDTIRSEEFLISPHPSEHIKLSIGNRGVGMYAYYNFNDLLKIKAALEAFAIGTESEVRIPSDIFESFIRLTKKDILSEVIPDEKGIRYKYKEFVKIEIHSNYDDLTPILVGYSSQRYTVQRIYQWMLLSSLRFPLEPTGRIDMEDAPPRMYAYNRLKSEIIERYICSDKYLSLANLQGKLPETKKIVFIDPDYDVCFSSPDDKPPFGISENDVIEELTDREGKEIQLPGIFGWWQEIKPIIVDAEVGKPSNFIWSYFHQRGMCFAKELREMLPDFIDLWYKAPFEDKEDTHQQPAIVIRQPN